MSVWQPLQRSNLYLLGKRNEGQTAHMSWWPRPSSFAFAPYNIGFWSRDCERFYQHRLASCLTQTADLKSATEWRDSLRKRRDVLMVVERNEERAHEFLQSL